MARTELHAREREQVDAELLDVHVQILRGLAGVGMEKRIVRDSVRRFTLGGMLLFKTANLFRDLFERLDGSNLIVRIADGNKNRVGTQRGPQILRIDAPAFVDW